MDRRLKKYEGLAEKFRSIGHPVRLAILDLLCNCGCSKMTVKSIYERLNMDQPSISRHLGIMKKSGVLERVQEGNATYYCFCDKDNDSKCIKSCFN